MKITEQFDDLEGDGISIEKMSPHKRRFLRTKNDNSTAAARRKSMHERGIKQRQEPSLPKLKFLEDA